MPVPMVCRDFCYAWKFLLRIVYTMISALSKDIFIGNYLYFVAPAYGFTEGREHFFRFCGDIENA